MLDVYFKEILENYEMEKTKSFKNNELVYKIRNNLSKEVLKFLDNEFIVKAACGVNSWPESPWVTIVLNTFDSTQEALILQYAFDTKKSEMTLSILLRLKDADESTSIKNFLINESKGIKINDFTVNKNDTSNIILYKKYAYNQIDDVILKSDLDYIVPVYKKLSKDFISYKSRENSPNTESEKKEDVFSVKDINISYQNDNVYENNIINPNDFFTDEIIKKIIKCNITTREYDKIIFEIKEASKNNLSMIVEDYGLNLNELSAKDKVLIYSKSFVHTEYKSVGRLLGSYSFNKIQIDDRLPNPLIITSIIHELSHFLLEKILKETLMKILETNDTPLISSYIKILLEDNDLNYLLDEFCAHTVEGRFALYGYQDYSSFKYKLDEISHLYSKEDIDYALILANTFAYDIKDIMEEFIDEKLRDEIKDEFLNLNDQPKYEPLDFEIESKIENDYLIESLALILTSGIGEAVNQRNKLERYMDKFGH